MNFKKYLYPYRFQAILGFLFKMLEALLELFVPLVVSRIINNGILQNDHDYITKMGILLFILAFSGYACALVCQYFASYTSQGVGTLLRSDMYLKINDYNYEDLDDLGTPTLITRITNDINQIQLAIAMTIRLVSRSPFLIIGSLIMAFTINVQIALIFVCISPLIALSIYIIMKYTQPLFQKIQRLLDDISLITRENLSGIRVIKAFNKESQELQRFDDISQTQKMMQIHTGHISALLNPATTIIVNTGIIGILYMSGLKINTGSLSQGDVVALINYMNQILLSMYVFANVILIFIKASASYKRIEEVLIRETSFKEGQEASQDTYQHLITFDHVSFSYKHSEALVDCTFTIDAGETIGIIGGTGSGKSTLVQLIPRFYQSTKGQIYIKDKKIEDYTYESLRSMIGFVPQKAVLFTGTIKDNLLWGKKDASIEDINHALEISQSYEFVSHLPEGIETTVEQEGKNFSGGQRQRLTIARAVIKNPDILILDDSASALDFKTDASLRKALKTLSMTTIIVSQRVSALSHANKIIVLNHGHIEDIGTHDDLLKRCALYQDIYHSQIEGDHHEE